MNIGITLVIQGLAFFAVAWLVMKFGWPNIMSAIEERQKKIADGLAAADRGQKDLDQAKRQADEIVREARTKAAQVIDQANRRSNALLEEAKGAASVEADRLVSAAREGIAVDTARARSELRTQVAGLAVQGASQLLGREVNAAAHADLLERLAAQIEQAAPAK